MKRPGVGSGAAAPVAAIGADSGAVAALLKDLGPQLRRGESLGESSFGSSLSSLGEEPTRDAMGLPEVDALLGGGVPRGRIVEIAGPSSSGRTSLALGWLARVTRAGEVAAVVDVADALDPPSAAAAGVVLPRILWVRAPGLREALRATERLLHTRGFALVLLDLDAPGVAARDAADRTRSGSWLRLSRAAASARTSVALLANERMAGTFSDLALELRPAGARFSPAPALLEAIESHAVLVRNRLGPPGSESRLVLSA